MIDSIVFSQGSDTVCSSSASFNSYQPVHNSPYDTHVECFNDALMHILNCIDAYYEGIFLSLRHTNLQLVTMT